MRKLICALPWIAWLAFTVFLCSGIAIGFLIDDSPSKWTELVDDGATSFLAIFGFVMMLAFAAAILEAVLRWALGVDEGEPTVLDRILG